MKFTIGLIALAFSVALNVAFSGTWAVGRWARESAMEAPPRQLSRELSLTPQQAEMFRHGVERLSEEAEQVRSRIAARQDELLQLVFSEEPDPEAVREVAEALGREHARWQTLVAEHLIAEKQLLDPRQRAHYEELLQEEVGRMRHRHRRRRGWNRRDSEEQSGDDETQPRGGGRGRGRHGRGWGGGSNR